MSASVKQVQRLLVFFLFSMLATSCVTETVESPSMSFSESAVISVGDPSASIAKGSTFAWLPEAVLFYKDDRLQNESLKSLLERNM